MAAGGQEKFALSHSMLAYTLSSLVFALLVRVANVCGAVHHDGSWHTDTVLGTSSGVVCRGMGQTSMCIQSSV